MEGITTQKDIPHTESDAQREKVRIVPTNCIDDFPGHPFRVKDDEDMQALVESISLYGVISPVVARQKDDGRYELISGHRRKYSSYVPAELKYVKVITTTTNEGIDKDQNDAGSKAATVTLLVTPEQAELVSQYNSVTSLHFALVYRGDKDKADAFIKVQDDYLSAHPITQPDVQEETDG